MSMKVGLTGNIGSGKTTVSAIFAELGIPVYNADIEARKMLSIREVIDKIVALFGTRVLDEKGGIDRGSLAQLVFSDSGKLTMLNELIHPLVWADYDTWHLSQGTPYTIMEAAILFESGLAKHFDRIILVSAPEWLRIDRVMKRDGTGRQKVMSRIKHQTPEHQLMDMAHFVVQNDGLAAVLPQVIKIDASLRAEI